jgi:hypothetical protein
MSQIVRAIALPVIRTTVFNQHRPADCAPVIGDRNVSARNLLRLWVDGPVHAVSKHHMRFPVVVSISTRDGLAARCVSDEQSDSRDKGETRKHPMKS